jgi:hypothetical protein
MSWISSVDLRDDENGMATVNDNHHRKISVTQTHPAQEWVTQSTALLENTVHTTKLSHFPSAN